jgi:hypothetical protein
MSESRSDRPNWADNVRNDDIYRALDEATDETPESMYIIIERAVSARDITETEVIQNYAQYLRGFSLTLKQQEREKIRKLCRVARTHGHAIEMGDIRAEEAPTETLVFDRAVDIYMQPSLDQSEKKRLMADLIQEAEDYDIDVSADEVIENVRNRTQSADTASTAAAGQTEGTRGQNGTEAVSSPEPEQSSDTSPDSAPSTTESVSDSVDSVEDSTSDGRERQTSQRSGQTETDSPKGGQSDSAFDDVEEGEFQWMQDALEDESGGSDDANSSQAGSGTEPAASGSTDTGGTAWSEPREETAAPDSQQADTAVGEQEGQVRGGPEDATDQDRSEPNGASKEAAGNAAVDPGEDGQGQATTGSGSADEGTSVAGPEGVWTASTDEGSESAPDTPPSQGETSSVDTPTEEEQGRSTGPVSEPNDSLPEFQEEELSGGEPASDEGIDSEGGDSSGAPVINSAPSKAHTTQAEFAEQPSDGFGRIEYGDSITDLPNYVEKQIPFKYVFDSDSRYVPEGVDATGMVYLGDAKYGAILQVEPTEWGIISQESKNVKRMAFRNFLSQLDMPAQALSMEQPYDISEHTDVVEQAMEDHSGADRGLILGFYQEIYTNWIQDFIDRMDLNEMNHYLILTVDASRLSDFSERETSIRAGVLSELGLRDKLSFLVPESGPDDIPDRKETLIELHSRISRARAALSGTGVDIEPLEDRDEVIDVIHRSFCDAGSPVETVPKAPFPRFDDSKSDSSGGVPNGEGGNESRPEPNRTVPGPEADGNGPEERSIADAIGNNSE